MEQFITLLKYIFISLVQGIAEILPISSSGHMVIVEKMLKMDSADLSFEIFLHFASLIAIIFYFRKKLWILIRDFCIFIFKRPKISDSSTEQDKINYDDIKHNFMTCIFLVIATIPAGIVGLLLEDTIEKYLTQLYVVGIFLIITSILLFISTKITRNKEVKDMKWYDALIIGLFQCIGIFPGISRSGSCIVGGATRRIKQSDAAEFAFLMAIPIMLGSALVSVDDISSSLSNSELIIPYIISFIVTLLTTYYALKIFLAIIRKQKLTYFSLYCAIAGVITIILHFVL